MIRLALALLIAGPALAQDFPPPAPQQSPERCAPRQQIAYRLANQFMEFARWQGLDKNGALLEWFGNEETGTWTLVRTTPDMNACMIAEGQGFSASLPVDEGDPA